jgi:type I restriction enzyme S subunit
MHKKRKRPEIRFAGHETECIEKKFDDTFDMLSNNTLSRDALNYDCGVAKNVHYGDVLVKFGEYLDVNREQLPYINDATVAQKFLKSYLKDGDIVIADTAEDESVGKCTEVVGVGGTPIISGLHTIPCRPKQKYAPKYMGYYLNSNAYHDRLLPLMQGVKVTSISKTGIKETDVILSDEFEEQAKIGEFLSSLDDMIASEVSKYKKLIIVKMSLMDKMFPKNGSNVPEVRFNGFANPWKQCTVGEILVERNEQLPKSNEYPLMAFVANEGVAPKGDRYDRSFLVNDNENKAYKRTEFGDFIYSSNNLETGSIGLNKYGKASLSPVYSIFEPTENTDSDFIGRMLIRKEFINEMVKWRQGVVYGQWRIHESDFLKINVFVPKIEEQRKIGNFLDSLDNLITFHQCRLEKLRNIKSSCMDKMFV